MIRGPVGRSGAKPGPAAGIVSPLPVAAVQGMKGDPGQRVILNKRDIVIRPPAVPGRVVATAFQPVSGGQFWTFSSSKSYRRFFRSDINHGLSIVVATTPGRFTPSRGRTTGGRTKALPAVRIPRYHTAPRQVSQGKVKR